MSTQNTETIEKRNTFELAEAFSATDGKVYQGWKTAIASAIGICVGPTSLLLFSFSMFIMPLQKEFGWSIGAIAIGATLISVMGILGALIAGFLVDRINSRKMVLCSLPLYALGVAAVSTITSNIMTFYGAIILIGILGLGLWPVTYNRATSSWFDRRLGLSLGVANAGAGVGAMLIPPIVQYIIAQYGWRGAYVSLGMIAIAAWPFMMWLFHERRLPKSVEVLSNSPIGMDFKEARKTRVFLIIAVAFAALGAISSGTLLHFAKILSENGTSVATIAGLQSVLGLSLIFGRLFIGWLADRVSVSRIMFGVCIAASIAVGLLAAGSPSGSAWISAIAIGFVFGAEFDILAFLIPRYFGRKSFGILYGTIYAIFQAASGIAVYLIGAGRDAFASYSMPLSVLALLALATAALFLTLPAYRFSAGHQSAR